MVDGGLITAGAGVVVTAALPSRATEGCADALEVYYDPASPARAVLRTSAGLPHWTAVVIPPSRPSGPRRVLGGAADP